MSDKTPSMKRSQAERRVIVRVRCIGCKKERDVYEGEIEADDVPLCHDDFMPMIPIKAALKEKA